MSNLTCCTPAARSYCERVYPQSQRQSTQKKQKKRLVVAAAGVRGTGNVGRGGAEERGEGWGGEDTRKVERRQVRERLQEVAGIVAVSVEAIASARRCVCVCVKESE